MKAQSKSKISSLSSKTKKSKDKKNNLWLKKLGIDTYREAVIFLNKNCVICRSEGFETHARLLVTLNGRAIMATLNTVDNELLKSNEASLSTYAWKLLNAEEGKSIHISHPKVLNSQDIIRNKINGATLNKQESKAVIKDIVAGYLSDIYISAFLTACANNRLSKKEIFYLTDAMIHTGNQLNWSKTLMIIDASLHCTNNHLENSLFPHCERCNIVVDKHCVGGLPGNRTSILIVPIIAAFGLLMPKTSSRAITSPAGTADTMEVFAPVNLTNEAIQRVVEKEKGCIVWGGSVGLSPADDLFIRIENVLNLDSEGQLVASVLSKKIAAGSTHIVIDIPIGDTAKVKTEKDAQILKEYFEYVANKFNITVRVIFSDGSQPIGRGIGPALEAKDILAILERKPNAPQDLRERALTLAGHVLELSPEVPPGTGKTIATEILDSGRALEKFRAICEAQGGMRNIPTARHTFSINAKQTGILQKIDNQKLATVAKLAGAPHSKAAGVELLVTLNTSVVIGQPLYIIHAETSNELHYAIHYVNQKHSIIDIRAS